MTRRKIMHKPPDGHKNPCHQTGNAHRSGQNNQRPVEHTGQIKHNAKTHRNTHGKGRPRVIKKPEPLAGSVRRAARLLHIPHITLHDVINIFFGPLRQVGDLQKVRKHVIAVIRSNSGFALKRMVETLATNIML